MKKVLRVILIVLPLLVIGVLLYLLKPTPTDYGTFIKMRSYQEDKLRKLGASERKVNHSFEGYKLSLPPLYSLMFKSNKLSLYLKSYETERIEVATINQLEIGAETGNFFDFTFMIRPKEEYNAPFFHGDALKALPGVTSALYMDFYSLNSSIDLDDFFRVNRGKLEKAVELAQPYWKHEGFGELTPHLDSFKSPWRLEMVEPKDGTNEDKMRYYDTVFTCFTLFLDAYLDSLNSYELSSNKSLMEGEDTIYDFVDILYREDIAVKMGKMIFPKEDFDKYFLEGFWGTESF